MIPLFLELNRHNAHPIFVNPEKIASMSRGPNGSVTYLVVEPLPYPIEVIETPEEIMQGMADLECKHYVTDAEVDTPPNLEPIPVHGLELPGPGEWRLGIGEVGTGCLYWSLTRSVWEFSRCGIRNGSRRIVAIPLDDLARRTVEERKEGKR